MFGKTPTTNKLAVLKYFDSGFHILSPGDHVICAMTRKQVPLDELKYWSEVYQEAYSSGQAAFGRYLEKISS